VLSYPSPLEEKAPLTTRIFLLLIVGFFEYVTVAIIADITDIYVKLCGHWFSTGPNRPENVFFDDNDLGYERIMLCLFALRFATRAKAFFRRPLKQAGRVRLHDFIVSSFWYNPALVFHVALNILSYCFKSVPLRFGPLYLFWCLMAPASEVPMFGLGTLVRTEEGRKKLKETSKGNFSFWYITKCTISTIFLEKVVTDLPVVTIHVTLFAQGLVYYSATWPKTRSKLGIIVEEFLKTIPETLLQTLDSVYVAFEWNIFVLARDIQRCALVFMRLLMVLMTTISSRYRNRRIASQRTTTDDTLGNGDRIRLLKVSPSTSNEASIECELQWYNIADTPKYKAISYTWGEPSLVYDITVSGKPVKVTRSARDVLRNLRSAWKTETLWIDAICIDQSSNEDKAQQIPLMPQIYEKATEIIVWLGPSKRAILATELVNRVFLANRLSSSSKTRFTYQIPKDAARALKIMLSRPWFERTWIVQEVVVARKARVTVRYGSESLSWKRLSWFTDTISRDPTLLAMLSERIGYSGLDQATALRNANIIRRFSFLRSEKEPLSLIFYLVQMFRLNSHFKATEVRDRVYALQGLSGSNLHFIPDYQKSIRQLFMDVVQNAVVSSAHQFQLDFLPHAGLGYKSNIKNLPSWTPDWTLEPTAQVILGCEGAPELLASPQLPKLLDDIAELESFNETNPIPGEKSYKTIALEKAVKIKDQIATMIPNATLNTAPQIEFLPGDMLQLRGSVLGSLVAVGFAFPTYTPATWVSSLRRLAEWSTIAKAHYKPPPSSSGSDIWQIFIQTLMQNRNNPTPLDFTFTTPFEPTNAAILVPFLHVPMDLLLQKALESANEEAGKSFKVFCEVVSLICKGRCFAVTSEGKMCMVMNRAEVGDIAVLIEGCRVPVVLRQCVANDWSDIDGSNEKIYELVGPAYIQGIMHGEGMLERIVVSDFKIR
jgi:hypothetical protein